MKTVLPVPSVADEPPAATTHSPSNLNRPQQPSTNNTLSGQLAPASVGPPALRALIRVTGQEGLICLPLPLLTACCGAETRPNQSWPDPRREGGSCWGREWSWQDFKPSSHGALHQSHLCAERSAVRKREPSWLQTLQERCFLTPLHVHLGFSSLGQRCPPCLESLPQLLPTVVLRMSRCEGQPRGPKHSPQIPRGGLRELGEPGRAILD